MSLIDLDLNGFIAKHVTHRDESLMTADLARCHLDLKDRLEGKRVLVIGGAGTIGSFYIKALLKFSISTLVVADVNENGLTELVRDLRSAGRYRVPGTFVTYPVDFGSRVFKKIFDANAPFDIVANFAAHKHVRSEKDVYSIEAMIENNLFSANRLLNMLAASPPERFFCVSTDKAANPVNIMGASKKLMEEMIMAYSRVIPVTTARFANVAFSNGSLLAGFIERVGRRQPLSCPSDIRRFFVSPEEAGELCLIASIMGKSGDILFPKLDPVKDMINFKSIALDFLRALGMRADVCATEAEAIEKAASLKRLPAEYPVYFFSSDTSGEKHYEEFFTDDEALDLDSFVNLGIIKNAPKKDLVEIERVLKSLERAFARNKTAKADVVAAIREHLPNFLHIETGNNLDQKM